MNLLGDILMLCLVVAVPTTEAVILIKTKSLNEPLTNMQVVNDKLYIGGKNTIYALDKDLNIVSSASTCNTSECENINKILLVNDTSQKLVSCGTEKGGICEVRRLSNLSHVEIQSYNDSREPYLVVSRELNRPAVGMMTNDGNFMVAVTNGIGIEKRESTSSRFVTYNYAISTRNTLTLYPKENDKEKNVLNLQISGTYQHDYIIYYKKGFQHNGYSYFVTNQKKEVKDSSSKYESKLVRICQNDTAYNSYADIVLSCENGYNLVQDVVLTSKQGRPYLIGIFTKGEDPEKLSGNSVICGVSLGTIDEKIIEAKEDYIVNLCSDQNNQERYLPDYYTETSCPRGSENISTTDLTCDGALSSFRYVIGKESCKMKNLNVPLSFDGIKSLHGFELNSKVVVLAGTFSGNIYMMNLKDADSLEVFDQKSVGTDPIEAIHQVDDDTLYVMTSKRIEKYVSTDCTEFKTCHSVMEHRNPLCGWCVFQNRATRKNPSLCPQGEWLQSFGSCVKLKLNVKGVQAGNAEERFVEVTALHLPHRENDTYSCRFLNGQSVIASVIGSPLRTSNGNNGNFSCKIPTLSVHTEATLELVVNDNVSLASTPFLFYKCDHYKRCGECIKATDAKCHWNLQKPECTNSTVQSSNISIEEKCPRLENNIGLNFIPRNHMAEIKLKASNLKEVEDFPSKNFWCYIQEEMITGAVDFHNGTLMCSVKIESEKLAKKEVQVFVKYGSSKEDSKELDDEFDNTVTVYDCSKLAEDCSQCKSLNSSRYTCSWCSGEEECVYGNNCDEKCPPPNITKIIPRDGPLQGNTLVTIYGRELGTEWNDINSVDIKTNCALLEGNNYRSACLIQNEDFSKPVPKCILCRTSEQTDTVEQAQVFVKVNDSMSHGNVYFQYKKVSVTHIFPKHGPQAGGTEVILYGKNLGVGNRIWKVLIGTQFCLKPEVMPKLDLEESSHFNIKCEMPRYSGNNLPLSLSKIVLKMDERDCYDDNLEEPFMILQNPNIIGASTSNAKNGFLSGGTTLTVTGKYLNNSNVGKVISYYNDNQKSVDCKSPGDEQMLCTVPEAPAGVKEELMEKLNRKANRKKRATCDGCVEVKIVVKLDGVTKEFEIRYYRDPDIYKFGENGDVLLYGTDQQQVILNGDNLNLVATKSDFNVTVGVAECAVIVLTTTELKCSPPYDQPAPLNSKNPFPEVKVKVGNIDVTVGYLEYEKKIEMVAIIAGAAAGGVVFIIIIIFFAFYVKYRKVGKKAKEYEQNLSNMEMEIRRVAREEFLDMHTTMSSVNKRLVEQGFPYHSYQQFACNVMFSVDYLWTEPVVSNDKMTDDERLKANKGMESLESLIYNKFFLVSVISTMEKEKRFFIKEKCNLAGNLCAVLMGKMDYLNEILKLLMTNLVQDSSAKKHKTLFRRCESITEKLLSNWISLCLYPHIKNHSGSPLYLLYMATQKTVESGPIDAVTSDAKYTLSEEKLLKNWSSQEGGSEDLKFEAKPLTLNLVVDNGDEIFKCKVLDCDTISQVKSKCLSQLYVNFPASQLQVDVNDLALEWHEGFCGVLKLRDIDNTSKRDGHWIRLNTLAHYNVKDDSNMALIDPHSPDILQQEDYVNLAQINMDGIGDNSIDSTEPLTPLTGHDEENPHHQKQWHLVKKEEESSKQGKSAIAELYLNRLFTTKQSIMEYIRPLFDVILDQDRCPPPTKFLFDFLDELGERYKVDSDTVHAWKSHSYAIRVWASLMKMPNLLFDVAIPGYIDDNLDVISQVFIESFSLASQKFTKDSPSQKLIFHHEMNHYRDKVKEFYKNVKVDSQNAEEFRQYMTEVNRLQQQISFNKVSALYRFYKQLKPYLEDILENLSTSKESSALGLDKKLEQVITIMEEEDDM